MQTTSSGNYRSAFAHIVSPSVAGGAGGLRGFYRGLVPAIEQRIVARGPMFLVSELFTQGVENNTSLSGTSARWTGSVAFGYVVGVMAGLAEYRKKLLSQSVITAKEARWGTLVRSAMHAGEGVSLVRRLHAAGTCAAVYDSTFFTTQEHLSTGYQWSAPTSFGAAAVAATVAAFSFDTGVARMMVVAPTKRVQGLFQVVKGIATEGSGKWGVQGLTRLYRGLPARSVEFAISYVVTGVVSVYVVNFFDVKFNGHRLQYFRCKRNDFHELLFAQFTGNWSEDPSSSHFTCRVQQYHSVVIESNVRSVHSADFFFCTYHNCV